MSTETIIEGFEDIKGTDGLIKGTSDGVSDGFKDKGYVDVKNF